MPPRPAGRIIKKVIIIMPAADYAAIINEWSSLAEYRADLGTNPTSKLITWAGNNNLDYARMIPKNTEVRKIEGVANQIQYCTSKAAEAKAKMDGKTPEPVAAPKSVKRATPAPAANHEEALATMTARMELAVKAEKVALKRYTEQVAEVNVLTNKCVQLEAEIRNLKNQLAGTRLEVEQVKMLKGAAAPEPEPEPESDRAHCDDCNTVVTDIWVAGDFEIDGYDILCMNCSDNRGLNEKESTDSETESVVSATSETEETWESDY